jgi:hypothetical protein
VGRAEKIEVDSNFFSGEFRQEETLLSVRFQRQLQSERKPDWLRPVSRTAQSGYSLLETLKGL